MGIHRPPRIGDEKIIAGVLYRLRHMAYCSLNLYCIESGYQAANVQYKEKRFKDGNGCYCTGIWVNVEDLEKKNMASKLVSRKEENE
jgi:hypothetical protein